MPAPYPKTGPVTLKTNLADSALAAALKAGKVSSPIVKLDFCGPPTASNGFKAMVREGAFDAGELAIVTFLQTKAYNKPLTLLPAERWTIRCTALASGNGSSSRGRLNSANSSRPFTDSSTDRTSGLRAQYCQAFRRDRISL